MKKLLAQFTLKPQNLFLLDASGAIFSALLLFFVLKPFSTYFGMPETQISPLAVIAVFLSLYSFSCFLFVKNKNKLFLSLLAVLNLLYCLLTLALVILSHQNIQLIGILYFAGEIGIILFLVVLELKTAKQLG